jgi:hypothetical protein
VRQLAAGKGFYFEDHGHLQLEGLPEPIHTFALRWRE